MANIKIELGYQVIDGMPLSFRAPCNCTEVTGIKVSYPDREGTAFIVFSFADAHGNDLTRLGNLFSAGAMVRVILDLLGAKAYIQNADTNAYLEGRFKGATVTVVSADKVLTAADAGNFLRVDAQATIIVSADVLPVGAEVEVFRNTRDAVTIASAGVYFAIPGNVEPVTDSYIVTEQHDSIVLKHIGDNVWSVRGAYVPDASTGTPAAVLVDNVLVAYGDGSAHVAEDVLVVTGNGEASIKDNILYVRRV